MIAYIADIEHYWKHQLTSLNLLIVQWGNSIKYGKEPIVPNAVEKIIAVIVFPQTYRRTTSE